MYDLLQLEFPIGFPTLYFFLACLTPRLIRWAALKMLVRFLHANLPRDKAALTFLACDNVNVLDPNPVARAKLDIFIYVRVKVGTFSRLQAIPVLAKRVGIKFIRQIWNEVYRMQVWVCWYSITQHTSVPVP